MACLGVRSMMALIWVSGHFAGGSRSEGEVTETPINKEHVAERNPARESGARTLEFRRASMVHQKPVAPASFLEHKALSQKEKSTAAKKVVAKPAPPTTNWATMLGTHNARPNSNPQLAKATAGNKAGEWGDDMEAVSTSTDHVQKVLSHLHLGELPLWADKVHETAERTADAESRYARDLLKLEKATPAFMRNYFLYHTKVDKSLKQTINDASLKNLERDLFNYYNVTSQKKNPDGKGNNGPPIPMYSKYKPVPVPDTSDPTFGLDMRDFKKVEEYVDAGQLDDVNIERRLQK